MTWGDDTVGALPSRVQILPPCLGADRFDDLETSLSAPILDHPATHAERISRNQGVAAVTGLSSPEF
ncbi:hypothetical protein R4282_32030 [Rhodococcus oxybenzonivorans]|uniref:hypothetical protein n=1 Tax=Rhodococcus TaxID=1827 RepID=UPI00131FCFA6|nr:MULTISPECIES: hypothetical protein [Rhodococcus]MDV7357623.1 hypothetical protein [Rhodococcus oxybenzonivorans]QHE67821.1 hypothetical protein GFS60_01329 [Rhodococcus sp. WAY2]